MFDNLRVAIFLLLNILALYLFVQLIPRYHLFVHLVSIVPSLLVTLAMFGRHASAAREVFVLMLWLFPQAAFLSPMAFYISENDLNYLFSKRVSETTFPLDQNGESRVSHTFILSFSVRVAIARLERQEYVLF